MTRGASLLMILFAACVSQQYGAPTPPGSADLGSTSDGPRSLADLSAPEPPLLPPDPTAPALGFWTGTANVKAGMVLKGGDFPVTVFIAQAGPVLRGYLNLRQDASMIAPFFAYQLDGTLTGETLTLLSSDRQCGATEPEDLCYPKEDAIWGKAFQIKGRISGDTMTWESAEALPGLKYPDGVAIEPPFVRLSLQRKTAAPQAGEFAPEAGVWAGPSGIAESVFLPTPLPIYADKNEITMARAPGGQWTISRFDTDGVNLVPTQPGIIQEDSIRYDARTRRLWFLQSHTPFFSWLWLGVRRGDTISGLIAFDEHKRPIYSPAAPPAELTSLAPENVVGVFFLKLRPPALPVK